MRELSPSPANQLALEPKVEVAIHLPIGHASDPVNLPRRILMMFALTGVLIAGGVALTWLLNPFGATRSNFINPIFRKVKRERLATPYMLRVAHPETLLLGSSRVLMGMRIEQGDRDGVMNAAIKGASLPEISRIVDVALQNPRLKRIVWGVDFFAFNKRWRSRDPSFNARIADDPAVRLEDTLLSLDALGDGLDMYKRSMRGLARLTPMMKAPVPWPMDLISDQYLKDRMDGLDLATSAQVENQVRQVIYLYLGYEFSPAQLAIFRGTVDRILAHNVQLVLFVPPMSEYELELIRQSGHWEDFEKFKRALAAIAPFYDFAAYNQMASHDEFYLQVIHFKPAPGHQMLRIMLGLDDQPTDDEARLVAGSARRIDEASIEDALLSEARMRDEAVKGDSRYTQVAAQAVRYAQSEPPGGVSGDSIGAGE